MDASTIDGLPYSVSTKFVPRILGQSCLFNVSREHFELHIRHFSNILDPEYPFSRARERGIYFSLGSLRLASVIGDPQVKCLVSVSWSARFFPKPLIDEHSYNSELLATACSE